MSVRSGQSVTVLFSTRVFSTGVGTNADSTPTGTLYVNGTADGASVTVTNITTGLYKAAVTLPTLAVGDVVSLRIAATVSSVTDSAVIWQESKDFFAGAIPDVAAGGANGLFIAGTNAATTVTTSFTTTFTGNLSGSVGSVTGLTASNLDATVSSRATPAQVNTECDTALADYDGPTNAEMVARTIVAADYATAANQTTINNSVLAVPAAITSDHGAGSYQTATGFSTPTNVTDAVAAIELYGQSHWVTATGFAVPGDVMQQDMTQAVPTTNTAQTVGDALNAARAQGFGKWTKTGTSLVLYAADGTTVVCSFTLDSANAPTSRV